MPAVKKIYAVIYILVTVHTFDGIKKKKKFYIWQLNIF